MRKSLFRVPEQALPQAHTGFPAWRESLFREAGFPLLDAFSRISLISRMLCICAEIRVYRSEIYVVRIYAVLSEFTVCGMSLFLHYNTCCKKTVTTRLARCDVRGRNVNLNLCWRKSRDAKSCVSRFICMLYIGILWWIGFAMGCSWDAKFCVSTSNPYQYAYIKKCCQQAHTFTVIRKILRLYFSRQRF